MTDSSLLVNLVFALVVAVIGGIVAARLKQPALVGYIIGGIAIGPYTPGFVGDRVAVSALADIGVILLMFTIGVQLSLKDLLRVGKVSVSGGLAQVVLVMAMGLAVGTALGWSPIEALFFGAFLSNSSSTVLSKVFQERGEMDSPPASLALAWSSVQDFSTVVLVVVLTSLAGTGDSASPNLLVATGKALLFLAIIIPLGLKGFPWLLERLVILRSRELFTLAVAGLALGTAYAATFFGLSLALGAFVAGVVVGESDLSHRVLGEVMPLRDIFAGMFFVSVGMLANPGYVAANPGLVVLTVALIVVAKGGLIAAILRLAKYPAREILVGSASLGQCAEFSFILAQVGVGLGVVGSDLFSLMLSAAAVSIVLVPYTVRAAARLTTIAERRLPAAEPAALPKSGLRDHAVVCGYGRVGRLIAETLAEQGLPQLVVDQNYHLTEELRRRGIPALTGHADQAVVLDLMDLDRARVLVVAIPDAAAARRIVDYAHEHCPGLPLVVRAHSETELEYLLARGVDDVVLGETQLALEMTRFTLTCLGGEVESVFPSATSCPVKP